MHPDAPSKETAKACPNHLKYFNRIQVMDGLIYVFNANYGSYWDKQDIDIFSTAVKYLYKATFTPPEGSSIYFPMINNILIKGKCLYVILEDEEGEVSIAKFKISLPG